MRKFQCPHDVLMHEENSHVLAHTENSHALTHEENSYVRTNEENPYYRIHEENFHERVMWINADDFTLDIYSVCPTLYICAHVSILHRYNAF